MLRVTSVMMRRRKELIGWSGTLLLVGLAVACSINPQPLPPDAPPGYDAGVASTPGSGGSDTNEGADAGAMLGASADGSAAAVSDAGVEEDGAAPEIDGGDGGESDAGDASPDTDGSPDASDAG